MSATTGSSTTAPTGDWPVQQTEAAGYATAVSYYSQASGFSTPDLPTGYTSSATDAPAVLSGVTTSSDYFSSVYLHCGMVQVSDDAQAAIDVSFIVPPLSACHTALVCPP